MQCNIFSSPCRKMNSYHLQGNGDHHNKQTKPDSDELNDLKLKKMYLREAEQSWGKRRWRQKGGMRDTGTKEPNTL